MPVAIDGVVVEPLGTSASGSTALDAQDVKQSFRAATTANGTFATAYANGQVVDGVTLATNDRVFLKDQSDGTENGGFTVNASGAPTRTEDWLLGVAAAGFRAIIEEGTANADMGFLCTNDTGSDIVGTDALVFVQYTSSGGAAIAHALGGVSHTADTLANLNTKISDGTVVDTGDARFSDSRTPTAHIASHQDGGSDELPVDSLSEAAAPGNDVSQALRPDGTGGVAFSDVAHADLTSVTSDQHHAQTHAAAHSDAGADELTVENLATSSADVSTALRPDGVGGLAFSDLAHADLTGVTSDLHHAQVHALGGADHSADTLANLNTKISDGTVVDTGDSRFTDDRVSPIFTGSYTTAAVPAAGGTVTETIDTGDIAGIGVNGIVASKITVTPSVDCDDYTVEIFRANTHTGEADFTLSNVTTSASAATAEAVKQDMTIVDSHSSSQLYIKVTNNDATTTPTFLIEIEGTTRS